MNRALLLKKTPFTYFSIATGQTIDIDFYTVYKKTYNPILPGIFSILFFSAGCGDGKIHLNTSSTDSYDLIETSTAEPIDSSTDTDTNYDSKTLPDSESDTESETGSEPSENFTVKMQAENFDTFDFKSGERQWYTVTLDTVPDVTPDGDDSHAETAHGNAYLEALPDVNDNTGTASVNPDPLTSPQIGFDVQLEIPGRYYVWVRAYTTGGEDNGLHAGIDGTWPDSGKNIQMPYMSNEWVWSSNQRDSGGNPYGIPLSIYLDVQTAGVHNITFAMREDGFEFDEWVMTTDSTLVPY
ncbi:MAG: hypothetical protein JXR91_17550 [Deltaproteobacteria bacterium]|nr:hypothetical protein [Deltaproteobacteria bacterium]